MPFSHPIVILSAMVGIRLLVTFLILKYLSSTFGPERFGTITQVMGIAAIFYMFAGGGISNGLIRSVAGAKDRFEKSQWMTAATIIFAASSVLLMLIALALYFFGAQPLFRDSELSALFLIIGGAQIVVGAGNIGLAYLSGAGDLKRFTCAHTIGSVFALLVTLTLVYVANYAGALIGSALLPLGPALFGAFFFLVALRVRDVSWAKPQKLQIVNLLQFGAVMAIGITVVPLAQLFVRADMGRVLGWEAVGYWQAVARLSDAYMQIFGVLFINFLLPRIAATSPDQHTALLMKSGLSIIGLFAAGAAVMMIFKSTIIQLIFSADFLQATRYVDFQLLGDFFKVLAGILTYYFVAKGRLIVQGGLELLQASIFILVFLAFRSEIGAKAAVVGHAVACAFVFAVAAILFAARAKIVGGES